jgi:hypothetical protein
MTTPTQDALMALAHSFARAAVNEALCRPGAGSSERARAALASAIAEVVQEAERARGQREVLARWMAEPLLTLDTIDPDDYEDGGDHLRDFMSRGQRLVDAVLGSAAQKTAGV